MTTNYYLGDRLIATRENGTLTYVHQDALTGTSLTTNSSGTSTGSIKYFSFGDCRNSTGNLPEQKFTGQRLDSTGLYYYGARYYDPQIGRFISPDIYVQDSFNPQCLNRYSYVINNPLKYTDPSGHFWDYILDALSISFDIQQMIDHPSWENAGYLVGDVILGFIPFVPAGIGPVAKGVTKIVKGVDKVIEGIKIGTKTEKIVVRAKEGFKSFGALKKSIGSAGEGKVWHHIVEQCQTETTRARFDVRLVQNPNNVISVDKTINEAIGADYSRIYRYTEGKTLRDWLTGQSFEVQYKYGVEFLKKYGVIQ